MEAALRTAYFSLTGEEYKKIEFGACRGLAGVKEASVEINGKTIKVAIASGMKNAKPLLDQIRKGESPYAFIEIMGCPGGCINGGGQPFVKPSLLPYEDDEILSTYRQKRAAILYAIDDGKPIRQSHNNPDIQKIYKDFLGEPLSELAEKLLHTHYNAERDIFPSVKK
jgi:NADP-reducing hydrogenase subunit HndD